MRTFTLSRKLCLHVLSNIGKDIPTGHMRERLRSLYVIPYKVSSFLDCRKECVHGHLGIILIESGEESGFQVESGIDGVRGETPKPIKGYPLEGANEQSDLDSIITYYITGLRSEVVNV